MKNTFLIITSFLFTVSTLTAQLASDAIRYSLIDYGSSTARTMGVGGAIGALGADFATLSTNPAGVATFRRSEFVITPAFYISKTSSELLGTNTANEETETDFNFANIGAVFVSIPRSENLKTFNFGIGFNRLANYDQEFYYEGSTPSTITDRFLDIANDTGLDAFEAGLAADVLAIYEDGDLYFSDFSNLSLGFPINKNQRVERSGSMNELAFAFGGNFREKLMFGVTVGVPFITFTEVKRYREFDNNTDDIEFFNALAFEERVTTNGVGINLKLGLIYRLNQAIRLGAAVHTPSSFGMDDAFSTSLTYDYTDDNNNGPNTAESPNGLFDYNFKTPWRYIGSAAVIIGRSGFISAEIEYVNHGGSQFNLTTNSNSPEDLAFQEDLNAEVESDFESSFNARIGGEYAFKKLRLRAGYSIQTSPYNNNDSVTGLASLGIGLRQENFYIDLGYQLKTFENRYSPYLTSFQNEPIILNNLNTNRYLLTIGYKI